MTPIIGKIIETKIMEELDKDTKGKLDNEQYGNTKGNSTTHYLVILQMRPTEVLMWVMPPQQSQ